MCARACVCQARRWLKNYMIFTSNFLFSAGFDNPSEIKSYKLSSKHLTVAFSFRFFSHCDDLFFCWPWRRPPDPPRNTQRQTHAHGQTLQPRIQEEIKVKEASALKRAIVHQRHFLFSTMCSKCASMDTSNVPPDGKWQPSSLILCLGPKNPKVASNSFIFPLVRGHELNLNYAHLSAQPLCVQRWHYIMH